MSSPPDLAVDADRLWHRLMRLGGIGATSGGGVDRQALTDGEHEAWRLLLDWSAAIGLEPATDPAANLFLSLPGHRRDLPPLLIGSHLDSQPTGGRFDGAFGVMAALEAVTALADAGIVPARDITVVAWMNEEGSRFAPGMMGSEAFAGVRPIEAVRAVRDDAGLLAGTEIDRIHEAFPGLPRRGLGFPVAAYLEPHIEQDDVLEKTARTIGIVTGIQGKKTFEVEIAGEKGHAGTLAMAGRRDAVAAFARIASALHDAIGTRDDDIKFTIGRVEVSPNAPSVVPGRVVFRIDLRHPDNAVLDGCGRRIAEICAAMAAPCTVRVAELVSAPSNAFDAGLQDRIEDAAMRRGHAAMRMISFAGHDARHLASVCPAAMIFIPCRGGVSHDESEWAEPTHVAAGAQVLLDVVVGLVAQAGMSEAKALR